MLTNIQRVDVTQKEYRAINAYSSTDLRALLKAGGNPLRYREKEATAETSAMTLGSAFDTLLLEPHRFSDDYTYLPEAASAPTTALQDAFVANVTAGMGLVDAFATAGYKGATEAKAQKIYDELAEYIEAAKTGKKPLTHEQRTRLEAMLTAASGHGSLPYVNGVPAQVAFTADYDGMPVKGLLDALGTGYVLDVKTTSNWEGLKGDFFRRGYDVQLALYRIFANVSECYIFYQESVEPYRNKLVDVTAYVNEADAKLADALKRMHYAHSTGRWLHAMEYYEGGFEPF